MQYQEQAEENKKKQREEQPAPTPHLMNEEANEVNKNTREEVELYSKKQREIKRYYSSDKKLTINSMQKILQNEFQMKPSEFVGWKQKDYTEELYKRINIEENAKKTPEIEH